MDELQKYYEHLKSQGAELPDYDSFKFTLEDEGSRREFYDYAKEQKYDVPEDYDTFSYTLFPPQGEVDPSKKKEETELAGVSPSPLQSGDSDSIKFPDPMAGSPGAMSEEQFTKQSLPAPPTTKLQDDFDPPGLREAADPVTKMLWNSLLKSGKPTEEQQAEIEKSTKYPPTLWNVFTSTLLSSGPGINRIPTVTYKTGEKKASDYERRNQQDFIEDMTPQGKAQLLNEAKESGYALNQKNLDIYRDLKFLETQMLEIEKGIEGFKDLDPNTFTPEQLKAAQTLVTLAETVPMMYNSKVDEYNSNLDDLKTFTKEIDLLKRQYGFVDNFVGNVVNMSRMLFAGAEETLGAVVEEGAILAGNAMAPASEFLTENVAGAVAQGGKKIREQASKDFFEAANAQMNYGIPRKGVDDLSNAEDVGEWMAQEVATQVPIITTIMLTQGAFSAPGVGASLIGGMTGGQKSIELREEGKYTKMQILFASLGHGAAETIGELGTEFVVMKGARALGAAKRSGEFARVRSGYKEYVKKLLTNAGYGATEAPAEVFTQLMQNAIDINLGKNISIWDGVKDAGASGLLLGEGMTVLPTIVGQALQTFQEPSKIEKLKINSKQMLDLELQIAKGEKGPEIIKKYQELSDNLRKENQGILDEAIEIANYSTEQERKTLTKAEAKVKETREILDNAKQDPEIPAKVIESLAKDHQKAIERRGDALNDAVLSTKARLDEITKEKPFKDELDNKLYRDIRMTMAQDPVEAQATTTVYSATLNTMAARAGVSREQMQDLVSFRRGLPTDQEGTLFQNNLSPKEFDFWFQDSKIKDEEGKPLEVYHGSVAKDITEFKIDAPKNYNTVGDVEGIYFSGNKAVASNYAQQRREVTDRTPQVKGKLYRAYLSIKNPLDITEELHRNRKRPRNKRLSFGEAKRRALQKLTPQHDGVIFSGDPSNAAEYIVFDPKQIYLIPRKQDPTLFQDARGAMTPTDAGFVVSALTDPNMSTPVHELAHIYEYFMTDQERNSVLKWAKHDTWTVDTSEAFARGFEKYLSQGKAPSTKLETVFEQFKNWLTDIYDGIKGSEIDLKLSPAMEKIYSDMLTHTEQSNEQLAEKKNILQQFSSENLSNLSEDDEGNFVFFHVSDKKIAQIDPSKMGTNKATSRQEAAEIAMSGTSVSFFYTTEDQGESMVSGANKYAVSVKKEEVYDYNMDPKNYKEKAKKEYKKKNPGKGFSENTMLGAVAGLAQKDGYKIIIHEWDPNGQGVVSRAISPIKLKPTDSEQYKGNVITKSFDKNYVNIVNKSLLTQAVFEYRQAKRDLVNKHKAKKISDKAFAKQKKELNKELGRKEKETGLVPLQVGIVPRTEAWNDGVKQALPNSPYTKEDLQQLLDDSEADFAILTAENPNNVVPTDVVNERLNEEARTWLEGEGLTPIEVFGKYTTSENSFFVPGMTLDQALSFAQIFNQEAVAHNKGFVYQDGSVTRRKEGFREYAKQKPTADYSTIKTSEGELYSFELYYDWGGEKFNLTDNTDKEAIAKAQVNLEEVMKKVEASQGDILFQRDRVSIPRDIAKQVVKKMMEATRSAENIGEITRIGSDELRATPWFQQLSEENQDGALLAVRRMTGIDELPIVDEGPTLADAVFGPLKVRVPSIISNDPLSLGGPLSEKSRNIQKNFIDKYHWLRTLQRNLARERGETIPPEQDFSRTEDLTHGRTEYRVGLFNERMKGIMKKMIAAGVRKEDVDAYMLAKHAPIRNKYIREVKGEEKKYSGVTDAWAHRMMRELRQDPKFNDIKEIAKDFYDIIEDTKKNYLEYGLENQEAIDDIEAMDFYVPMRGFAAEGLDNGLGMDASGSLPIRGRENKGLKGRTTLPDSPISNIEAQHINSITRGERNKVMNTLYELAKAHPDESLWEIYNNPGGPLLNSILKDQASNKESPYVSLKVDGKQVYIKFAAPRLAVTLRKLDVQKVPKLFQAATTMNRWLSNVFTQWNPDFMVGNFARDIQTAITNILSEVETSTGSANIENWRTNLSSEAEQARLIKDVVKDTFLSIGTITQVLRGVEVKNKRLEKYFREFREDGGQTAWYYPKGVEGLKKSFDKQFAILAKERNALEKSGDYVQALGKLLEDTNSAIENGVRLATYVQLRKRGATRFDAADVAKNLTVNFNRSGEYGTLMNSLYLFFNASVQGSARMARAVFTMKKVFNENTNEYNYKMSSAQKLIAGMTMMNFILALFNRSWSGEDEDGVLYYDKIPQYEKERNIIIMLPEDEKGDYIKIPMPYGYSIFANLGTVLADTSTGPMTKGEALDFMLGSMLNSFMPVNFGESDEFFKGVAKNAIPTVFKPIIELAINENYFGAPIYNEDFDGAIATPEATKGRRNTPAAFKEFSLLLNEVSGGTENIPGKIDINPEVLHYLFDYYLGGTGRTVTNLAEVSASSWDKYVGGQEVDVKQSRIPILRRFYGEQVRHLNDGNYFARKEKVGQWFNEYKKGEGRKVPIPPKDVQFLYDRAKAVDRRLKILRKDRDKIYKMPNGKEKAKWQNKWDKEYFKVIAQFNKEWEKRVESAK